MTDQKSPVPPADGARKSQGLCGTTLTERFVNPDCRCDTYEGNLGPCKTFEIDQSGSCVYCDHEQSCHPSPAVAAEPTDAKPNYEAAAIALGYRRTPSGVWWHPNQHPNFTERFKAAEAIFDRYFGAHWLSEAVAAEPDALAKYIPDIVKNAMLTMWNEICADTDCHPLDITHGAGKILWFTPHHWAEMTGAMVARNIADLYATPPVRGDREAIAQRMLQTFQATGDIWFKRAADALSLPVQPGAGERAWPQPFATAPRDGTPILARCNDHSEMYALRWDGEHWACRDARTTFGDGLFLPNGDWCLDPFSRQAPHSSSEGGR